MTNPPGPDYEWDSEKSKSNALKHGVAFDLVLNFDWDTALEAEDIRYDYGEVRMQAIGKIGDRYHMLVYVRRENTVRVISLRKTNKREEP